MRRGSTTTHTRTRRALGAFALLAVLAQAGAALAVNEPLLVGTDPTNDQQRRSVTVTEIKATYDRQLKMPPESTIEVRDASNNLVSGHVVTTGGGAGQMTLIFRPDALLSEFQSPYTAKATAVPTPTGDPTVTTWKFSIDDTPPPPPSITSPPQNALLRSTSVVVAGTTAANAPVALKEGATAIGITTADASGNWQMNKTFADGPHSIVATTFDPAGNESAPSNARNFTVDSTAPAAPSITTPPEGATVTSTSVSIAGSTEPNASIVVKEGATTVATALANASGDWTTNASLADGTHAITATATDVAGNTSAASAARTFTVDLGPPELLTSDPPDHRMVTSASRITTTWNKAITGSSTIEVRDRTNTLVTGSKQVNGSTMTFTPSSGAFTGSGAPYTWTTQAFDSHGNASALVTLHFGIGAIPVITTPVENTVLGSHTVSFTGSGPAGMTAAIREGATTLASGIVDADGKWNMSASLADGAHIVTAVSIDAAGNTSEPSAARNFGVDTGPPSPPVILTPGEGAFIETAMTPITGTAEARATVRVFDNGVQVATTAASGTGSWSVTVSFLDGAHTLTARATDLAGNTSAPSAGRNITVQRLAPPPPVITHPAQGASVNRPREFFTGTGDPGTTIRVMEGTTVIAATTVLPSGLWIVDFTLPDGPHAVTAVEIDAGKSSVPTPVRSFVVDTVPPRSHITTANLTVFNLGTTKIEGTAIDANGIGSVDVFFNTVAGTPVFSARADLDGPRQNARWSLIPAGLVPGIYQVRAYATDLAGNTAYSDETILIVTLD